MIQGAGDEATSARHMPACPICGSVTWTETYRGLGDRQFDLPGVFSVQECAVCGLWRTWPVPEDLAAHYPDEYGPHADAVRRYVRRPWHVAWPSSFARSRLVRGIARRLLQFNFAARNMWTYLDAAPASVFDYGCGSGHFLGSASQLGVVGRGMDVSSRAVDRAHRSGVECSVGTHSDLADRRDTYEIVRLWHVLEHVPDPVTALKDLRRMVAPGGRIVVAVPNRKSALETIYGPHWLQLDLPRHLWHFDESTLRRAMIAAGYVVERVVYDGVGASHYESMRYALVSGGHPEALDERPDRDLESALDRLAQEWNERGLGDSMVVVASVAQGSDTEGAS